MVIATDQGRSWSTAASDYPGVYRYCNRQRPGKCFSYCARISFRGKWVKVGQYADLDKACRVVRIAQQLKKLGKFDLLTTAIQVRDLVRKHLG